MLYTLKPTLSLVRISGSFRRGPWVHITNWVISPVVQGLLLDDVRGFSCEADPVIDFLSARLVNKACGIQALCLKGENDAS